METPKPEILHPRIKANRAEWRLQDIEKELQETRDPKVQRELLKEKFTTEQEFERALVEEKAWKSALAKLTGLPEIRGSKT